MKDIWCQTKSYDCSQCKQWLIVNFVWKHLKYYFILRDNQLYNEFNFNINQFFNHFIEIFSKTARSHRKCDRFEQTFERKIDDNNKLSLKLIVIYHWNQVSRQKFEDFVVQYNKDYRNDFKGLLLICFNPIINWLIWSEIVIRKRATIRYFSEKSFENPFIKS